MAARARHPVPALLVRSDGGTDVGLGHLVRSMALAEAWRARGGKVTYALAPDLHDPLQLLSGRCESIESVQARAGSARDACELRAIAARVQPRWIVLDGYRFGPAYRRSLRRSAQLALIDDLGNLGPYEVDALINHNVYASASLYRRAGDLPRLLLLGSRYALLRQEFVALRRRRRATKRDVVRILVTLGGGSSHGHLGPILASLDRLPATRIRATIVVGPADPCWDAVVAAARGRPVHLVRGGPKLPRLLAEADLAITSAGSISWELCCLGVPALQLVLSQDQRRIAAELDARGCAVDLGAPAGMSPRAYARQINILLEDPERRRSMSLAGRRLIDGRGAARVAQYLWRHMAVAPAGA
jgi:UDP-2,4-diacetamido-2,4,6-trideoxy-beta-L-altropyranose hydrolase